MSIKQKKNLIFLLVLLLMAMPSKAYSKIIELNNCKLIKDNFAQSLYKQMGGTYNEEKHIKRCILSIKKFVKKIIIIDSFSTDKTIEIAKKFKVKVYKHKFINQAKQINWALRKIKFQTSWILRIDADEYLTKELRKEVTTYINTLNCCYIIDTSGP